MNETLAVGMIVWPILGLLGIGVIIAIILYALSIFADAFKH